MVKKVPKKRTWRKADIADVEEGLEEARQVKKLKRQGPDTKAADSAADASVADGELDDLFTIDTAGSGEGLSKKTKRELARARLFPKKGPNLGLSASEELKVARAEAKLECPSKTEAKPKGGETPFDLWSAPAPSNSTAPPAAKIFGQIRGRKYAAVKMPGSLHKKVSKAPAVIAAHEGQSMNPELNAYEDLACTAAARQIEKERELADLDRKIKPMTHELREATEAEALKGMSEAEKIEKFRSLICKPRGDDDQAAGPAAKHIKHRMKSQAHKNRDARRKVEDDLDNQARLQEKLEKSVGDLGAVMKELKETERLQKEKREYRAQRKAEQQRLESTKGIVPRRRRIGRNLFEEHAIAVPDAVAAAKGLRSMPLKGGSAIHERISSIMRRGMLPATPEATRSEIVRRGKKNKKLKRSRKPISPLLRDNQLKASLAAASRQPAKA